MAKCEIANKGIDNQAQFDIETFRNDVKILFKNIFT